MIRDILRLGDERLYQPSQPVKKSELPALDETVQDLHDTLMEYRRAYGAGRAIAAPQIAVPKRIIYMSNGERSFTLINPNMQFLDDKMMEVMDDCMSFPGLKVKVMRHRWCVVTYRDRDWQEHRLLAEDDMAELLQHEYDHLDGILATMRAADDKSLFLPKEPNA